MQLSHAIRSMARLQLLICSPIYAGEQINKADVLSMPCDVLVPAAIGGVINEGNAASLQCKVVAEAANGPTTPQGDQILRERGIDVLPGTLKLDRAGIPYGSGC